MSESYREPAEIADRTETVYVISIREDLRKMLEDAGLDIDGMHWAMRETVAEYAEARLFLTEPMSLWRRFWGGHSSAWKIVRKFEQDMKQRARVRLRNEMLDSILDVKK
jgi:hypothetical protein